MVDQAFLRQSYESYTQVEEQFQLAMDESLEPRGLGILEDLIARLDLPIGATALDVGCGEGDSAIELAQRFGLQVRGIDPVPWHIETARAELATASQSDPKLLDLVAFESGAAESVPVADHSVDLIWCRDVLTHINDLGQAYAEFRRALHPDGHILIYQMFATEKLEPREAAWLLPVMGCIAPNMNPDFTEAVIKGAGLQVDECIILGSEWGEVAQERTGSAGRHLLHAARLQRDPDRYIRRFGQANYDIALGDCLWHVYRMLGKLSGRIYRLSAPVADEKHGDRG